MKHLLRRALIALAALAALTFIAAAIPIGYIELRCKGTPALADAAKPPLVTDAGYRRAGGDSFMTYPEWYIVQAYADLAAVTRQSTESHYGYGTAIGTFWSSLCGATRTAVSIGPVTGNQRLTDYVIGLSFSLEMAVQGLWERTIGAATVWTNSGAKTQEDAFNQRFLDDYANFLQQTPWYRYPFESEFARFWRETPYVPSIRSTERRIALSLEYGVKGLYAALIGAVEGEAPADLSIMSVVAGSQAGTVPGVTVVRGLGHGLVLVKTPRYTAFTDIIEAWAKMDVAIVEIAGNQRILTTMIAKAGTVSTMPGAIAIFSVPVQSRPGWERTGFDTEIGSIPALIHEAERQGAIFEHVYDYTYDD